MIPAPLRSRLLLCSTLAGGLLLGHPPRAGAAAPEPFNDIPAHFTDSTGSFDFIRREIAIPMRDKVTLHTVLIIPRRAVAAGAKAPILLDRTPYDADDDTSRADSAHGNMVLPAAYAELLDAGYIVAFQDVRGKHGSKGDYVNERPLRGPENPTEIDHATDAWDTVDWLVHHVAESNGRVGMIGTSYDGMMVAMALAHPHPALKAAVPANPVIDTWMGDDDFHGGAFRMAGYDYYYSQDTAHGKAGDLWRSAYDDYTEFLRAGSATGFAKSHGIDQLPVVRQLHDHPAYDSFWQHRALQTLLASIPQTVPTLWIAGQWDQEDMFGAVAAWEALHPKAPSLEHLVLGPWRHGGWAGDGSTLGPIRFDADTALWFRREVLLPFLDAQLKPGAPASTLPPVLAFQTGSNRWQSFQSWPESCETGCPDKSRPLYLRANGALSFDPPAAGEAASDEYVSDPNKPVPYRPRPIRPTYSKGSTWRQWLVDDQRFASDRTDVLTYQTGPLDHPVAIAGAPVADLVASTTGTDADFVVKLIDVYPDEYPPEPAMGGYQLPIAMDILRGRYREGFETAKPITPNTPLHYRFTLPNVDHVFLPGHRIMVQVQSSWFPLYDRNPQRFVENVFDPPAKPLAISENYIFHTAGSNSVIYMPIFGNFEMAQ
ncbi:CocE/NonD family hydrolase [Rhizosaccharibacter radicis]|uniref:CocE/NonD family hydrolase n=1 Tax=Rhizosaccharibacter radicis TaxID=2782605 RepID=A0ABT1W0B4_9PROT|nr:CocE/NonD family hydrolase [Acetobacteraceae bacterium KSS12]